MFDFIQAILEGRHEEGEKAEYWFWVITAIFYFSLLGFFLWNAIGVEG